MSFNFKDSSCPTNLNINSLSIFTSWNEVFATITSHILELDNNMSCQEYLTLKINNLGNQIKGVIETHKLVLNYPQGTDQSNVLASIKEIQNQLGLQYKVSRFVLVKTSKGITRIEIIVDENEDDISPNLAMNVNLNSKQENGEMKYYCAITDNDIFVYQIDFKEKAG